MSASFSRRQGSLTHPPQKQKPLPKKTIVISITLPCYFPLKTSNSAILIHCIHFIKLLTNFNLFKLTLLTRFYRPFDSISFHKHPSKDASNNRIWVISLCTKTKNTLQCTQIYKIKYLFDMTLLYKFAESLEVALFIDPIPELFRVSVV